MKGNFTFQCILEPPTHSKSDEQVATRQLPRPTDGPGLQPGFRQQMLIALVIMIGKNVQLSQSFLSTFFSVIIWKQVSLGSPIYTPAFLTELVPTAYPCVQAQDSRPRHPEPSDTLRNGMASASLTPSLGMRLAGVQIQKEILH